MMSSAPVTFTIASPPGGGPQQCILGTDRWLWWWTPGDQLSTVSAKDGSDFRIFAQLSPSILHYTGLATTGPLFLMEEFAVDDGGAVQGRIAYSDGIAAPKPYLVPPDPNDDYGAPAFANASVGFIKGVSRKEPYVYDHTELWATPYSVDPSALNPELIGSLPFTGIGSMAGGWGHVATSSIAPGDAGDPALGLSIWTLATKWVKTYAIPTDRMGDPFLGVTRTHVWLGGRVKGVDPYLMRFKVE